MVHIKKKKEGKRIFKYSILSLSYHKDHIPSSRFSRSEIRERTFSGLKTTRCFIFVFPLSLSFCLSTNSQQMALMTKKNYPVGMEQVFKRKKINFLDCLIC